MTVALTYEPVINRQMAMIAVRLVVNAESCREAVDALNQLVDAWPSRHDLIISPRGFEADSLLVDLSAPVNAVLALRDDCFASAEGRTLATLLKVTPLRLCVESLNCGELPRDFPPIEYVFSTVASGAIRHRHSNAIALGANDHDAFLDAIDAGFGGACGWFFLHSAPALNKRLQPAHAQIIHVLNLVRQNAEIDEIEAALKQDISISFKLLRYINSAGFGLATPIRSFRHAVTLIGYSKLNRWLSLLLVTASQEPAASVLMQTAITRGRFMESVGGAALGKSDVDNLFITGSFSLLDSLLGTELNCVLKELNLPAAITDALLDRSGPYAPFLQLAKCCESDDALSLRAQAAQLGVTQVAINRAMLEAIAFADNLQLD